MLSILKRGTVEAGNKTWEFHGDSENNEIFYITPQPQFVMDGEIPKIEIVEYQTTDDKNGSGYVQLQVELGVPEGALAPISAKIKEMFGVDNPNFQTLAVQSGTIVNITYPDGDGSFSGMQVNASDFASNFAVAQIQMDSNAIKEVKTVMAQAGSSPFTIDYSVIVPSFMPAVTCEISFDSSIAFSYEVTKHAHHKWAHATTYTYDISKTLSASDAAKVTINKVDPNVSQETVDDIRKWAQSIIAARVSEEVQKQISLMENSGGHQTFNVSQLSSFSETYAQNETIMWRVHPTSVLPSFGQLGLSVDQINSLEPSVDVRKFVMTLTPAVSFVEPTTHLSTTAGGKIAPSDNPFMKDIKKLKALEVTVHYPTLNDKKERTFTFTSNEPNIWTSDWDDVAGGEYSISYVATYEDDEQIKGTKNKLTSSEYILRLADVGILNVTFNATKFFAAAKTPVAKDAPSGIDAVDNLSVNFVFEVPNGERPFLQNFTLDKTKPIQTITSVFGAPVGAYYDYTLTYVFKPEAKAAPYTSNARRQNSQNVDIAEPDLMQPVSLVVNMGDSASESGFIQVAMNFYYDGDPVFPDIPASKALPVPTASSPIHFEFDAGGTSAIKRENFTIFANSKLTPLMLNASGLTNTGASVNWGPVNFDPQATTLLGFFAANLFTYVDVDPSIVDWSKNPEGKTDVLTGINTRVTKATYKSNQGNGSDSVVTVHPHGLTQTITPDPQQGNRAPQAFFKIDGLHSDFYDLSFDWEATYIYKTAGSVTTKGTTAGTKVALPATPPQGSPKTTTAS